MTYKNIVNYTIAGMLIGMFVFQPLFVIVGHAMLGEHIGHGHTFNELLYSDLLHMFTFTYWKWNIGFAIVGALVVNHVGYVMDIYCKVRDLSNKDSLTSLANRRYQEERLDEIWKQSIRLSQPVSIIMCDIDNFKAYNDTYGHQKGDVCLKLVSRTLKETSRRPLDLVARYGGEEFIVVLPDTSLKGALHIAEKMRTNVESLKIIHETSKTADVITISLGVSSAIPTQSSNYEKLISSSDKALYKAKKSGRNKVESLSL